MNTPLLYLGLILLVAAERLLELWISNRNARRLLLRGAVEEGASHYPAMVLVHTAFLFACPLEVFLLDRSFIPALGYPALGVVVATMGLRYWVIATLGERWNTRVICLPAKPLVVAGPFRLIKHPNYVAVVFELLALPLVHSAWITALVFGIANALVLRTRIKVEDAALARHSRSGLAAGAS